MRPAYRIKILFYFSLLVMSFSGFAWLILDNYFQQKTIVGLQKHPWQGFLINFHGCYSYLFSILFGYIIAAHVSAFWAAKRYRFSGNLLLALISLSIASGASLVFLSLQKLHNLITWVHIISGISILIMLIFHVRTKRR